MYNKPTYNKEYSQAKRWFHYFCPMLTDKEIAFIEHWKTSREPYSKFASKLIRGLPVAIMFGLPIILFVLAVYIYFPDWYAKLSNTSSGSFVTIVIAVIIAILFFSYFRMHFNWEMNEQLYKELIYKQKKAEAAKSQETISS